MTLNTIIGDVTVEDMIRAADVDTANLKEAIEEILAEVDILVALRVLSEMIVAIAKQLHGVQMQVVIEPKASTPAG